MTPIPTDVLDIVLSLVRNKRDLCRVCLASTHLLWLAQRHLYRELNITKVVTAVRLCRLLLSKPRLQTLVRRVEVQSPEFLNSRGRKMLICEPGYQRLLYRALRKMTLLDDLRLQVGVSMSDALINLKGCSFRLQLLALLVRGNFDVSLLGEQAWAEDLGLLLRQENSEMLRRLRALPPTALPRMRELGTTWRTALSLVPNRRVTDLKVMLLYDDPFATFQEDLAILALSNGPLLRMKIIAHSVPVDALRMIACSLPTLVELYVVIQTSVQDIDDFASPTHSSSIPVFPALKKLSFMGKAWPGLLEKDWAPLVLKLGEASPRLTKIGFHSSSNTIEHSVGATYVHFRRDVKQANGDGVGAWHRAQGAR